MFVINEPQKLQILYESLEKSTPESFKVYGAIFHIKNKNPFNLEVLVARLSDSHQSASERGKETFGASYWIPHMQGL
ncbi:glycine N-acyltransferase-like protein 2 isoform 1-T5 [Molossus nigricans]